MSSRSTLDLSGWPAFDEGALPKPQRDVFLRSRTAIELYACGETVSAIEARTGLHRRQLYRLLDRCQAPHDDGRPFGWRAVVPYAHVNNYERTAGTSQSVATTDSYGSRGGAAGAFTQLLRAYPTLARWIEHSVQAKRITIRQTVTGDGLGLRLGGLKALHADFLRQCRS